MRNFKVGDKLVENVALRNTKGLSHIVDLVRVGRTREVEIYLKQGYVTFKSYYTKDKLSIYFEEIGGCWTNYGWDFYLDNIKDAVNKNKLAEYIHQKLVL